MRWGDLNTKSHLQESGWSHHSVGKYLDGSDSVHSHIRNSLSHRKCTSSLRAVDLEQPMIPETLSRAPFCRQIICLLRKKQTPVPLNQRNPIFLDTLNKWKAATAHPSLMVSWLIMIAGMAWRCPEVLELHEDLEPNGGQSAFPDEVNHPLPLDCSSKGTLCARFQELIIVCHKHCGSHLAKQFNAAQNIFIAHLAVDGPSCSNTFPLPCGFKIDINDRLTNRQKK